MASSAVFAWAWIPEVEEPRRIENGDRVPSKALENLGAGSNGIKANGIRFQGKGILYRGKNRQE
jgi:hypothetical protein